MAAKILVLDPLTLIGREFLGCTDRLEVLVGALQVLAQMRVAQRRAECHPGLDLALGVARRQFRIVRQFPQHVVGDDAAEAVRHQQHAAVAIQRLAELCADALADPVGKVGVAREVLGRIFGYQPNQRHGQPDRTQQGRQHVCCELAQRGFARHAVVLADAEFLAWLDLAQGRVRVAAIADVELNFLKGRGYFGLGVGMWGFDDDAPGPTRSSSR